MTAEERHSAPRRTRMPAARRRETILRAAAEVFAAVGYRAAKVSDIAARVGVTEPVVFQNFGSKPALFAAVLEDTATRARASLEEAGARFGSAAGLLAHVLGQSPAEHVPFHQPGASPPDGEPGRRGDPEAHRGPEAFGVLFGDAITLAADPAVSDVSGRALRALAGHLADIARQGQADGSARADLDPEAVAWLLISVLATRPLRRAAMPADLEPAVTDLAVRVAVPAMTGSDQVARGG